MSCKDFDLNCVCDVVRFINDLQDAVDTHADCPENCLRPQLGVVGGVADAPNTRPFLLYTKKGELFEAFYRVPNTTTFCPSPIFRVESVDGCCAVLRVLRPETTSPTPPKGCETFGGTLIATDQCVVVDLNCFCAIQCLEDRFIAGVC